MLKMKESLVEESRGLKNLKIENKNKGRDGKTFNMEF